MVDKPLDMPSYWQAPTELLSHWRMRLLLWEPFLVNPQAAERAMPEVANRRRVARNALFQELGAIERVLKARGHLLINAHGEELT